jgi:hypothetical protein
MERSSSTQQQQQLQRQQQQQQQQHQQGQLPPIIVDADCQWLDDDAERDRQALLTAQADEVNANRCGVAKPGRLAGPSFISSVFSILVQ